MPKVDLSAYAGREQAYVKHCLLEEYLPEWAYKVGSAWDTLVYVDGFAGPWQVSQPDYSDSSFGVAIDALSRCHNGLNGARARNIRVEAVLVDESREAFEHLKRFAAGRTRPGFHVHSECGQFARSIPAIERHIAGRAQNPFKFVFLDPKGWVDIPMQKLMPFIRGRSCEVLINLMTRHIIRFLDEDDRSDSYENLFGRTDVLQKLRTAQRDERAEMAVREYCKSLHLLCDFKYVSQAVILEPDQESVRYFLIYGTNHPRGVEVFKSAETKAARIQDAVRHEAKVRKTGQDELMFEPTPPKSHIVKTLRSRYMDRAKEKVISALLKNRNGTGVPYADLFCDAMAFPLVTPEDLEGIISSLSPHVSLVFANGGSKKPRPDRDDLVVVADFDGFRRKFRHTNS